jgi:MYXO-CTERM domain-containing protein
MGASYDTRNLPTGEFDTATHATLASASYDGLTRRWTTSFANGNYTNYYYDLLGRLIEEFSYTGNQVNGANSYEVVDHLYLTEGAGELGRVQKSYQKTCPTCGYSYKDDDLQYVHEDVRKSPFGIESKVKGALAWEGEIDPFGTVAHEGLPGPDGKIGTADDLAATTSNPITFPPELIGACNCSILGAFAGSYRDSTTGYSAGLTGGGLFRPQAFALSAPLWNNVMDSWGPSAYARNGGTVTLGLLADRGSPPALQKLLRHSKLMPAPPIAKDVVNNVLHDFAGINNPLAWAEEGMISAWIIVCGQTATIAAMQGDGKGHGLGNDASGHPNQYLTEVGEESWAICNRAVRLDSQSGIWEPFDTSWENEIANSVWDNVNEEYNGVPEDGQDLSQGQSCKNGCSVGGGAPGALVGLLLLLGFRYLNRRRETAKTQ